MEIRVIPAYRPQNDAENSKPKKLLRVAAYARVSTEFEEQENSYEAQCKHYEHYIKSHEGWVLAGIYADDGQSATSTKNREQFNRMIADCEQGLIDMIMTKSISRFARNTLDCLQNVRKLKALNIPVIFEKEAINTMSASGELFLTIMASLAQQESASISQNTRMGWQYSFQRGKPMLNQSRFMGYTKNRGDMKLTIVPEEADIVRSIFRLRLEGFSIGEIIIYLEERQIRTPGGNLKWHHSTVKSMLQNEKFMGDLLLQKSYTSDFLTKERKINDGVFPQYYVENAHEPVVPREVFYQVQGKMDNNPQEGTGRRCVDRKNVFSGIVFLKDSGEPYRRFAGSSQNPTAVWRCREKGFGRPMKERDLEDATVAAFNRLPEYYNALEKKAENLLRGPMGRVCREYDAVDTIIKELESAVSDYAISGTFDRHIICLYGNGKEDPEAILDGIKAAINEYSEKRMAILNRKGTLAVQEAQTHSLLKMTEEIKGTRHVNKIPKGPACYTLEDFYNRTDEIYIGGKLQMFDGQLVRRFIEKIDVGETSVTVRFRAGVNVEVMK